MSFTTENPISQYAGNDVTDEFTFSHKYYDEDDIVVVLTNVAGAHTVQTKTTHYTLAGIVSNPSETTVCTVTMVTAPATGETLTVYRKRDLIQEWIMGGQAGWRGIPLELQLDHMVMQSQWLRIQVDKAVKYNMAFAGTPLTAEEMAALGEGILDGELIVTLYEGGSVLSTGTKKIYVPIPYNCTIQLVTLLADQSGSVVVDIWKDTYANFPPTVADSITAAAKPTLSGAIKSQDSTLTGWTKILNKGDILEFNIDSAATITKLIIAIEYLKTS